MHPEGGIAQRAVRQVFNNTGIKVSVMQLYVMEA